ncbi:MAG: type IX secretion system sortase PorU [Tangfeifania sp.]
MMNKYLFFLLVILFGFSANDVRREFISLDWQKIEFAGLNNENSIGLSFENAVYPASPQSMVPYFSRIIFSDNQNSDMHFEIKSPVFKEIKADSGFIKSADIPEEITVDKFILKSGNTRKIELLVPAVIRDGDKLKLLKEFELKQVPITQKSALVTNYNWKNESVLSSGNWKKISTSKKGVYKIPYSKLTEWGFSNPSQVKVFGAGGTILPEDPGEIIYDDLPQIAVWHGENSGTDCLFFHAPGTVRWKRNSGDEYFKHTTNTYSKKGFFFLTEDVGDLKKVAPITAPAEEPAISITDFDDFALYEKEIYNLLHSGKRWFGEKFIHSSVKNISLPVINPVESQEISVRVKAAARSSATSNMEVSANQAGLGALNFSRVNTSDDVDKYADLRETRFSAPAPSSGSLDIVLKYFGNTSNAEAWLDFIEINYRRKLKLDNEALFFREKLPGGSDNILEFKIETATSNLKVWDVSDAFNVKEIPVDVSGNEAVGKVAVSRANEFVAFNPDGTFPEPELVGEVSNQNLHSLQTPEFLIVSHPVFLNTAEKLANFHRSYDGMSVEVVSSEKVFNEFSSGMKSATGIRNFIKMFYDRNNGLKYVLLFGDGSYDNRNINADSHNFIPTFQSENSLSPVSSFVTDDYFVMLDAGESVYNGAVDLGIGRIPASTVFEAELVLNKIQNYYSPEALGDWRNVVSFIGDDQDKNQPFHMTDSEKLADKINANHPEFITDKIYLDAYPQITGPGGESYPDVTEAINERVKNGVLILNYVGHANERFMADEKVLDISNINSWSNANTLPIFVTATCEFSRFDSDETSAGEYVLLNPSGGGIGLFSTTRLVFAFSNFYLSRSFYEYVFKRDENGEHYRMGDVMRLAKINTINTTNKRNFSLLADPALKLSYPQYKVVTTSVNGRDAISEADTLGALQKVTVSGHIEDYTGEKLNDFSGEITPTVFDKAVMMETLGNGGYDPVKFKVQENVIYKGATEVTNGEFTFSFVVPRDISYSLGEGKIIYYATNGEVDANGAFSNFYIGGPGADITDNEGPEIELFLDSEEFQSGDKVGKNPTLLANLSDESGINTAGTGIGHDITAVIDRDYSNVIVLNNYYEANPGEYTSGTLSYPLKDLPAGKHTLTLKAWDVANNSSEAEIEFEVSGDFVISGVTNYPNPVYDYTFFTFEHNQADATLETVFEVFDQSGRKVDYFTTEVGSSGTSANPVRWDLNELGIHLRSGTYIYKITAQNDDGVITSHSGKMLIGR